ncbi:MAG: hypothetical protein JRF33_04570 [Deltaproteobacteria bacterium]|nr:hypothetical protein [Deltaproteobacteria bacterium]
MNKVLLVFSLALIFPSACEDSSEHYLMQDSLRRIEKSAKEGFMPTVGSIFESHDGQLDRQVKSKLKIMGKPADVYQREYRAQAAAILLRQWPTISGGVIKSAKNPENLKNQKWHDENYKRLDRMILAIGDEALTNKWQELSNQRQGIEDGHINGAIKQDVAQAQGKVLVWSEGLFDRGLRDCILAKVRPFVTDKEWAILDKPPSSAALQAAWGTVVMHFDMQYTEYVPSKGQGSSSVVVRVPSALVITVKPKLPKRSDLPEFWRVQVLAGNPKSISKGSDLSAKMAAAQLNVKRISYLLSEACKRFSVSK